MFCIILENFVLLLFFSTNFYNSSGCQKIISPPLVFGCSSINVHFFWEIPFGALCQKFGPCDDQKLDAHAYLKFLAINGQSCAK